MYLYYISYHHLQLYAESFQVYIFLGSFLAILLLVDLTNNDTDNTVFQFSAKATIILIYQSLNEMEIVAINYQYFNQ